MSVMWVCIIACIKEATGDVPVAFFVAIRNVLLFAGRGALTYYPLTYLQ